MRPHSKVVIEMTQVFLKPAEATNTERMALALEWLLERYAFKPMSDAEFQDFGVYDQRIGLQVLTSGGVMALFQHRHKQMNHEG